VTTKRRNTSLLVLPILGSVGELAVKPYMYVEIWLNPRTELKTAMTNIKTVTYGDKMYTIFG
jgi:hypothetical protein